MRIKIDLLTFVYAVVIPAVVLWCIFVYVYPAIAGDVAFWGGLYGGILYLIAWDSNILKDFLYEEDEVRDFEPSRLEHALGCIFYPIVLMVKFSEFIQDIVNIMMRRKG